MCVVYPPPPVSNIKSKQKLMAETIENMVSHTLYIYLAYGLDVN